jgi:hypothetical protein
MKIVDFSEKMNLYGIMFMFIGIVGPVVIGLISSLGYAPTGSKILAALALPFNLISICYILLFPSAILLMILMIKFSDPTG